MNYVELIQHQAQVVFGNKEKADSWLAQPKTAFGGVTPLQLTHTEAGYELVKAELERINQGYVC